MQFELEKYKHIDIKIIKKPFLLSDLKNYVYMATNSNNKINEKNIVIDVPNLQRTHKTKSIFDAIFKVVKNDLNVLISGESGTGKKQVAHAINSLTSEGNLLEIDYLDYKNNSLDNLLLNKISFENFLKIKKIEIGKLSNNLLFSNIDAMDIKTQNLLKS